MFIYYIFIFIVGVILRSLLIAQFSTSYEEERGRARVLVTVIRTRLLLRMETVPWIKPLLKVRPIDHFQSASAILYNTTGAIGAHLDYNCLHDFTYFSLYSIPGRGLARHPSFL